MGIFGTWKQAYPTRTCWCASIPQPGKCRPGRYSAAAAGISYSSVQRIWRAHGLKPHLVKTFKVSRDKNFAAKVEDVVGLYLNPPDKALVFCVDEKSQIQALDRTQPGLPLSVCPKSS